VRLIFTTEAKQGVELGQLQVTGYRLQVTGYRLQVTGYRLYVRAVGRQSDEHG